MENTLRIHEADTVCVALEDLPAGTRVSILDGHRTTEAIPFGHKIALTDLQPGDEVVKFGHPIGHATKAIAAGSWVHTHNLATALGELLEYEYTPTVEEPSPHEEDIPCFSGYRRSSGKVGTRNEIWVINTVGCVNRAAERIARICNERFSDMIDGVHAFIHPYGCSQLGDDLKNTQRVLSGLIRHPNAGGVLVLGLGCENNRLERLLQIAGDVDTDRIRLIESQFVENEVEEGNEAVEELVRVMGVDRREDHPVSDLVLGLKCGGSDGFSGISANPLVGTITDLLTGYGGTALLTEVPEMFGAEQLLMNRAVDENVFRDVVQMINRFKEYFIGHGQPIYENPSPGNMDGGITTLEEKSLGAVQKGGRSAVTHVLDYGEPTTEKGLGLIYAPGNDGVSVTAEVAAGATVVLFTTGRGTPLGFPVPTIKVSSNTPIFERKPHWIDFNAGALLDGSKTMLELRDQLFETIIRVASGTKLALNEKNDYREIAIWKEGVTL